MASQEICSRVFSRIGLLGNPSDGFFGKTISISCANFWAEVALTLSSPVAVDSATTLECSANVQINTLQLAILCILP